MTEKVSIDAVREHVRLYIDRRGIKEEAVAAAICGLNDTQEQRKFLSFLHGTLPVTTLATVRSGSKSSSVPTYQSKRLNTLAATAAAVTTSTASSSILPTAPYNPPSTNHEQYSRACCLWLKEHGQRPGYYFETKEENSGGNPTIIHNRRSIVLSSLKPLNLLQQHRNKVSNDPVTQRKALLAGYFPILEATSLFSIVDPSVSNTDSIETSISPALLPFGDIATLDGAAFFTTSHSNNLFSPSSTVTPSTKRKRPVFFYTPSPTIKRPHTHPLLPSSTNIQQQESVIVASILERISDGLSRISASLLDTEYRSLFLNPVATIPKITPPIDTSVPPLSFPSLALYTDASIDPLANTLYPIKPTNLFYVPLYIHLDHASAANLPSFPLLQENFLWDLYESHVTPLRMAQSLVESLRLPDDIVNNYPDESFLNDIYDKLTVIIANAIVNQLIQRNYRCVPYLDPFLVSFLQSWKRLYAALLSSDDKDTVDTNTVHYWYLPIDILDLLGRMSTEQGTIVLPDGNRSEASASSSSATTARILHNPNPSVSSINAISLPLFEALSNENLQYFDNSSKSRSTTSNTELPTNATTEITLSPSSSTSLTDHPSQAIYYPPYISSPWYPIISPLTILRASLTIHTMETSILRKYPSLGTLPSFLRTMLEQCMVTPSDNDSVTVHYTDPTGTKISSTLPLLSSSSRSYRFRNLYLPIQFTYATYTINYRVHLYVPDYLRLCEEGDTEAIHQYLRQSVQVSLENIEKDVRSLPENITETSILLVQEHLCHYIEALVRWDLDTILDYTNANHISGLIRTEKDKTSKLRGKSTNLTNTTATSRSLLRFDPSLDKQVKTITVDLNTLLDDNKEKYRQNH